MVHAIHHGEDRFAVGELKGEAPFLISDYRIAGINQKRAESTGAEAMIIDQ